MKVIDTEISDVKIVMPEVFEDERGFFFESFNENKFRKHVGQQVSFVQDNQSKSSKGVLRGLHYQLPPKSQGKLIRVIKGEIYDVVVDIRRSSLTFGHWLGMLISEQNQKQLWIPKGFAHGFIALSEAIVLYKTTDYYTPEYESTIQWNDPELNIDWFKYISIKPTVSKKDQQGNSLETAVLFE